MFDLVMTPRPLDPPRSLTSVALSYCHEILWMPLVRRCSQGYMHPWRCLCTSLGCGWLPLATNSGHGDSIHGCASPQHSLLSIPLVMLTPPHPLHQLSPPPPPPPLSLSHQTILLIHSGSMPRALGTQLSKNNNSHPLWRQIKN